MAAVMAAGRMIVVTDVHNFDFAAKLGLAAGDMHPCRSVPEGHHATKDAKEEWSEHED